VKMRIAVVLVMILSGLMISYGTSIENMANQIRSIKRSNLTVSDLPKGYEEKVLAQLRKERAVADLIRLNDQETIDKSIEEYKAVKGKDSMLRQKLESCCAPWILDELAPLLYEEEVPVMRYWAEGMTGNNDYGYSMSVAEIMTTIVGKSPEFSEVVRKTADTANPYPYRCLHPERVTWMRKWWEINQNAILAERFADVTPITQDLIPAGTRERLGKLYRAALAATATGQVSSVQNKTNGLMNTIPSFVTNSPSEKSGGAIEASSPLSDVAAQPTVMPNSPVAAKNGIITMTVVTASVITVLLVGYFCVFYKKR